METLIIFAIAIVAILATGTTIVYLMYLAVPTDFKLKHQEMFQDVEARSARRNNHYQHHN